MFIKGHWILSVTVFKVLWYNQSPLILLTYCREGTRLIFLLCMQSTATDLCSVWRLHAFIYSSKLYIGTSSDLFPQLETGYKCTIWEEEPLTLRKNQSCSIPSVISTGTKIRAMEWLQSSQHLAASVTSSTGQCWLRALSFLMLLPGNKVQEIQASRWTRVSFRELKVSTIKKNGSLHCH